MKKSFYWIGLLAALPIFLGAAQPFPLGLAPSLAPLVAQYKLPGIVGCIIHGDQIVALGSAGVRKLGDPAPFLRSDQIHLASDTKAMTAILIGKLIDKHQLTFDTPMREIFPDFAAKMNRLMDGVTVRQLLDHDAGLQRDLWSWTVMNDSHLPLPVQRQMTVRIALSCPPITPIGSYSYSDVDYVLLGAIVERKTGMPWEKVIQREIFDPLHMTSAGFGAPGTPGKVDEPWGHALALGFVVPIQADSPPVMEPSVGVHCSIGDCSKFISEILRGARGHPTLLSAKTFKELITPTPNHDYAGGWTISQRNWARGLALTDSGSNTAWCCTAWIAPNRNFAVLDATNYGGPGASEALNKGAGLLIGVNETIPN